MQNIQNYVLCPNRVRSAMSRRGITTFSDLARRLGLHRNTLGHFLSGRPVLPESVAQLLNLLDLSPAEALKRDEQKDADFWLKLAPIVDTLHQEFAKVTFILFGSRARGNARQYSDIDIGIYCADGVDSKTYLQLIERTEVLAEDLPWRIEIVNFHNATSDFIKQVITDCRFISGSITAWQKFLGENYGGAAKSV